APLVLAMAAVLLGWTVSRAGGLGPMLDQPSKFSTFGEFWAVFVPSLTGMIGFWATLSLNIPDFTRFGRGQKEQMLGQALGLSPKRISFKTGGLITGLLGIVIMPWRLLSSAETYIFNWLIGYSALLGPIAGIMIADYWILRKTELDVADLYRTNGRYAGTNWI